MQDKTGRLTDRKAQAFPAPAGSGYVIHWCPATPGFGVRITAAGGRSWIAERRVNGKTVRRTLGRATGRGAISAEAARKLMVEVSSELQRGIDRNEDQRAQRVEEKRQAAEESMTFGKALEEYVTKKRRAKDGLPLKARTASDYRKMIEPGKTSKSGAPFEDGPLFVIAETPIARLTADDIHEVHRNAAGRGVRQSTYAMQVLRAVLNWHGVAIPGNPLSRDVAGKDRITLPKTAGNPHPIPPEKLAAWWKAATEHRRREAADYYLLILLTGARPGEVAGIVASRDVDLEGERVTLRDTKNRTDHVLYLSRQAMQIVAARAKGKRPGSKLFTVTDPRKTLDAINAAAGTAVSAHDLRATFASVAEELVSAYSLKRLLNHVNPGDVTGTHYVGKSEAQLRAAWQTVADAITNS